MSDGSDQPKVGKKRIDFHKNGLKKRQRTIKMEQLNETKIHKLRDMAKEYAIVGRWNMKKKDLRNSIEEAVGKEKEGVFPCHKTRNELAKEAKDLGIVGVGALKKIGLRSVIEERKKRGRDEIVVCIHEDDILSCQTCVRRRFCIHGKERYFCKDCGGTQICVHDKRLFNCFPCAEEKRRERRSRWHGRRRESEATNARELKGKSDSKKRDESGA